HALYMRAKYASEFASRSISGEFAARNSISGGGESIVISSRFTKDMRADFRAQNRLLPHSTHCYTRRPVDLAHRRRTEGSPRDLTGLWSCERQFRRRDPKEPKPMSILSTEKAPNLENTGPKKGRAKSS